MLIEAGNPAQAVLELGFGGSTFRLAVPAGQPTDVASLSGRRIATSYAGLLGGWLTRQGIDARVVKLDGAVENAVRLGVADAIADVVDTGTTLRLAGLQVIGEPLLNSQAVLLKSPREVDDALLEHPDVLQAAAFGVPCVMLLGPTSLEKTRLNLEHVRVLVADVPCRPCYLRTCPIDHRCMTHIPPEEAIAAALPALARRAVA